MSVKLNIIVFGVTSSLFGAFPAEFIRAHNINAFVRPLKDDKQKFIRDNLENLGVVLRVCDSEENFLYMFKSFLKVIQKPDCVLHLSSHVFSDILYECRSLEIPTLFIGSGAVTDWMRSKQSICDLARNEKTAGLAEYIETKAKGQSIATTTFNPGFFIADEIREDTGRGLHLDSTNKIFAPKFDFEFNWMKKRKFVTPMSMLVNCISRWSYSVIKPKGVFTIGSSKAYYRWELRKAASLNVPAEIEGDIRNIEDPYEEEAERTFGVFKEYKYVDKACKAACKRVQKIK